MLQRGDKSDAVKAWQQFLIARGLTGLSADGDFGPETEAQTKIWQTRAGLDADGRVGPATIAKAYTLGFTALGAGELPIVEKDVHAPAAEHVQLFVDAGHSHNDAVNEAIFASLCPATAAKGRGVVAAAGVDGIVLRAVQGLRTWAYQAHLFAQGRTAPGPRVTNAKPGQSNHNYGTAIDFGIVVNGQVQWNGLEAEYNSFGKYAAAAGMVWGGNFHTIHDRPHFEYTGGLTLAQMQALYAHGGLAKVWEAIK